MHDNNNIFFYANYYQFYWTLGSERDDDNEYLRHNKLANYNQNRHSDRNHSKTRSTFKSSYRGSNQLHKSWQGKAHLVRDQLNCEFSHRNRQLFKNR